MNSKYKQPVRDAIDLFWLNNHYPPTIRDLIDMTGGTASTSHINKIVDEFKDIRIGKKGRIIPKWADTLFDSVKIK